jgi:hypothetical protein
MIMIETMTVTVMIGTVVTITNTIDKEGLQQNRILILLAIVLSISACAYIHLLKILYAIRHAWTLWVLWWWLL